MCQKEIELSARMVKMIVQDIITKEFWRPLPNGESEYLLEIKDLKNPLEDRIDNSYDPQVELAEDLDPDPKQKSKYPFSLTE